MKQSYYYYFVWELNPESRVMKCQRSNYCNIGCKLVSQNEETDLYTGIVYNFSGTVPSRRRASLPPPPPIYPFKMAALEMERGEGYQRLP